MMMVERLINGCLVCVLFVVMYLGALGYFILAPDAAEAQQQVQQALPAPIGISEGSLVARVLKLERMLSDDVPSESPITPDVAQKIVDRREADKETRRRATLIRQLNQTIVFSFSDGVGAVSEFSIRDRLVKVKDDHILQDVLTKYVDAGWDVEYVEGPYPTSPTNAGVYKFKSKAAP